MSQELFGRIARLKVGPSAKGVSTSLDTLNPTLYEGFRITFEIGKSSEKNPNTSTISIYNLSRRSRAALESNGLRVALEAGYAGLTGEPLLSQIFIGDIKHVKSERRGADIITIMESGDSEVALTETKVNETFGPNTPSGSVIATLAKKFDVAIGTIMPGLQGIFENGLSLSGSAAEQMDILTKKAGLEWHITDGELNILDPKLATPETPVLISVDSGLIGIPSKKENKIEFDTLINPLLKPGRAVSLVSANITGVFKARRLVYSGDTHGGDWKISVEAE